MYLNSGIAFTLSFVAPLSVAQALMTALAEASGEQGMKRLQVLEEEWAAHDVYHSPQRAAPPRPPRRRAAGSS